jgi:hypothetical protein
MPIDFTAVFAIFAVFGSGTLVLRPIAKALAGRIAGRTAVAAEAEHVRMLEAELHDATQRLSAAEAEIARTAEKMEFMEKLLAGPAPAAAVLPSKTAAGAAR